jgi:hypothetical protein
MRQEVIDTIVESLYSYRVGTSTLTDLQDNVSRYGLIIEDHNEALAIVSELEEEEEAAGGEGAAKPKKPSKLKKYLKAGAAVAGTLAAAYAGHKAVQHFRKKGEARPSGEEVKSFHAHHGIKEPSAKRETTRTVPAKEAGVSRAVMKLHMGKEQRKRELAAAPKHEPKKPFAPAAKGKGSPKVKEFLKATVHREPEPAKKEDSLSVHDERLLNLLEMYRNGYLTFDSLRESLLPLGIVLHDQSEALYLAKSFIIETTEADEEEEEETPEEEEEKKG